MECAEAREHLADLNRGQLGADLTEAVRGHAAQCPACQAGLEADAEIRTLVRAQVPRYTVPPALRASIQAVIETAAARPSPAWRRWLRLHPWPAGALAGAVCLLLLVWGGYRWMAKDPVSVLAAQAVAEHAEYIKEVRTRPAADPVAVVKGLRSQVDFPFEPIFQGDPQVQLVAGMVGELSGRRAATFIYKDRAGRYTTLFLMPGAGIVVPEGDRMLIETFRPHYRTASGRSLILWKHRDLAWLLVSDLDKSEVPAMYLKVRKAA